ncbi:NAD(P)-binding domain-containing protein [Streptomyces polyrhachis]|uniref:NAD(P)-binding domain-containing protein n=1 Tax=Streptomyces polyrhachis TaxID=1282885 RepID=A0ABW2GEN6_9ACTN
MTSEHDELESPTTVRYLIVGAGPAGLQLGYFLAQQGANYLILEAADAPGAFFRTFPRHRRLISLNKVNVPESGPVDKEEWRLRWDWNSLLNDRLFFPAYSRAYLPDAGDLVRYLGDFQREHALNVRFDSPVEQIAKDGPLFTVRAAGRTYRAQCVIMATGWGGPNIPGIKGIELARGYEELPTDGRHFTGQRVLIIGKGNSAFETAHALLDHAAIIHLASPRPLRLSWHSKHPGDVRGQYGALLDSYWFKTLHGVLECDIDRLSRVGDAIRADITYTLADGEKAQLEYDAVLRCTGFTMDSSPFAPDCVPRRHANGRIPELGPDWQSVNVDGLYFAGTLMQGRDLKRASSAFIDGFRYNLRTMARLLAERYEHRPLEREFTSADPAHLTRTILERLNHSSALWTQFEYLVDVFVPEPGGLAHYRELPEDYALSRFGGRCLTAGLRWGPRDLPDVFAIRREPVPEKAHESAFIHPVVRSWRGGELVGEQHLLEDLSARWHDEARHAAPLRGFLAGVGW